LAVVSFALAVGLFVGLGHFWADSFYPGFDRPARTIDAGCPSGSQRYENGWTRHGDKTYYVSRNACIAWQGDRVALLKPNPPREVAAISEPPGFVRFPDFSDAALAGIVAIGSYFLLVAGILSVRAIRGSADTAARS
jgi:hypothetical protein